MAQAIADADLRFGDVVLNYCDPRYVGARNDADDRRASSQDHLLRLLVYSIFAQRIFIPANYVLSNRAFFAAVSQAPELLSDGILVVHLHEQHSCFSDLASDRGYDSDRRARAEFLDARSKYFKPFSPSNESALYHSRLLEDVCPSGALRALIPGARRGKHATALDEAARAFEGKEGSRAQFVETMSDALPKFRGLFERWAALRYYLTPMELERVRIRDLPHSAAALARRSGIMRGAALEDPDESDGLPEPMNTASEVMKVHLPVVTSESDARCLVTAALATRNDVPQAREKFSGIVSAACTLEVRHELNAALKSALVRERLLPTRAGLTDQFLQSAKDTALGVLVELMLGRILGALAMVGSGVARAELAQQRQQKHAPWRVSYETLAGRILDKRKDASNGG